MNSNKPKLLALYHYYCPDDVVSAKQYSDLCEGLIQRGWEVEVWPCNRGCHNPYVAFSTKPGLLNGVNLHRVWRPPFRQHFFMGRIFNSLWMQKLWWWRLAITPSLKPSIILIGTDPIFSLFLIPWLKLLRPKAKVVHWCFDLYPEAAIADGIIREKNILVKLLRFFMKKGYQNCDLLVDIGSCMRGALSRYLCKAQATLTPWALEEPPDPLPIDPVERKNLFGDSRLGLLYSGSFGRAHEFYLTLKLARLMKDTAVFAYGVRGSRLEELKLAVNPEDSNVRFVSFAPPERLSARLSAPDVHVVSLRSAWTGIVVPSKFFGALAAGRPVLFEGEDSSAIAQWIKEHKVGWVLNQSNLELVAKELIRFSKDESAKASMFKHCHEVYQTHFSKKTVIDRWDKELRALLL